MQYVIFSLCVIAVIIIAKIFSWPFKKIIKLIFNIALGLLLIVITNILGENIELHIPFNISGLLGVPGVGCLIVLHYIF